MNILIIDDDKNLNKEFIANARLSGYTAHSAESVSEGLIKLNSEQIDFAVVDLDFGQNQPTGETLIEQLNKLCVRVPVVIHTGNPSSADKLKEKVFGVFKRGCDFNDIFDRLKEIQSTGINEILGKSGFFEIQLQKYYEDFFLKAKDKWIERAKNDSNRVKQSLLRNLIYRIELKTEGAPFYEEFYLPSFDLILHTGSIVKNKHSNDYFLIITPACDIEYREHEETDDKGNKCTVHRPKVNMISLCKIESVDKFGFSKNGVGQVLGKNTNQLFQNSNDNKELMRYHWLPPIESFDGGFLNFSNIGSVAFDSFFNEYDLISERVSYPYLKNIMSRFSSYFARQGQPDLDIELFKSQLKWNDKNSKLLHP